MARAVFVIVARADDGTIGERGGLAWHIPADLKRFKALTLDKPMIMGRKTFESLPSLLPRRRHIVITRDAGWSAPGAEVVHDAKAALSLAGDGEVAVIGGAEIIALMEPFATRIELTEVHGAFAGDTVMAYPGPQWRETMREAHPADGERPAYDFVTLERV